MNKIIIELDRLSPELTKEFNKIAEQNRVKYTQFIDELSIKYKEQEFWWDTSLASRNIYLDHTFESICMLLLIKKIVEEQNGVSIITNSKSIKKSIEINSFFTTKEINLIDNNNDLKGGVKTRIRRKISPVPSLKGQTNLVKNLFQIPNKREYFRKRVFIVSSYREYAEFQKEGYHDRYFDGLEENTDSEILFFCHPYFERREELIRIANGLYKRLNFIMYQNFVQNSDYKEIDKYRKWCKDFSVNDCYFDGINITPIIREALNNSANNLNSLQGILKGNAINRCIDYYELDVKGIIDWYEGQPSSLCMIRRLRKENPAISTAAYVLSPCPENNLSLFPSKEEIKQKIVAEKFCIQGEAWEGRIKQFCTDLSCLIAPSFRYKNIFESEREFVEKGTILLVLPYLRDSAKAMLDAFFDSAKEYKNLKIYIKNHPNNFSYSVEQYGIKSEKILGLSVKYEERNLKESLRNIEMVLISQTSAALEVMFTGAYTMIYVPPGKLNHSCLPDKCSCLENLCYDSMDISRRINEHIHGCSKRVIDNLRDKTFTVVNRDTVHSFLESIEK